jgi:probable F420-dependent oxidoreductase
VQPFRFVLYTNNADEADRWTTFVRRVEELGYAALYLTDHLGRQLAPTAGLAAAAAVTSTLRIGPYVLANDFRHPLIVAREAATLDRLSGGRLDLGLGAGWKRDDYRQLGMPYDPPGTRIDRMSESLGIIRRLLSGEEVTHEGRFYRLDRARVQPAPVQRRTRRSCSGVVVHACSGWLLARRRSSASCRSSRPPGGRCCATRPSPPWPSASRRCATRPARASMTWS